jgi:hypothetical protein
MLLGLFKMLLDALLAIFGRAFTSCFSASYMSCNSLRKVSRKVFINDSCVELV